MIEEEEKQFFSRDIMVHEDDTRRDGRLIITNKRFLIEKRRFKLSPFGKQDWVPLLDINIDDPIELSLDEKGKCVIIKRGGDEIKICARDISIDKLIKEIERNIDIARNISKNSSFSSKKIIYEIKKSRGIK